jgi:L-fuculose-phosphate aldolase
MSQHGQNVFSEDDPKFRISVARRILYRNGLDSQIGGHISVRIPDEDAFFVTPYEYFDETMPDHVMKVGFDLNVIEPGPIRASPGINFHSNIYRSRPDVNCVIHTHARNTTLLSSLGAAPKPFQVYGALFHEDIALFRDDPLSTPDREGEEMTCALGGKRAMLMANHGALHVGRTLEEVTVEAILLEIACGYQIGAMAIGGVPLDDQTASTYRDLYLRIDFREEFWKANYRRAQKSDPDLFALLAEA